MDKFTHPSCLAAEKLLEQCDIIRTKSGGPGGQHRNKVESAVVVTHRITGIVGQAGERRSQHENRTVALQRLRLNLAIGFRQTTTTNLPSQLWQTRCTHGKIKVSRDHGDFACLLAEALDCICDENFQVSAAAKRLQCSTSQLIKFLKTEDSVFAWVNRHRKELGIGPLK